MALRSDGQTSALGAEFALGQAGVVGGVLDPQVVRQWESAARLADVAREEVAYGDPPRIAPGGDPGRESRPALESRGRTWLGAEFTLPSVAQYQAPAQSDRRFFGPGSGVVVWSTDGVLPGAGTEPSARAGCSCGGKCGGQCGGNCGKGSSKDSAGGCGCGKGAATGTPHGASAGNPWPLDDPRHNLVLLAQELLLLEGHLADPERWCPNCVTKHALTVRGLADEGRKLDTGATLTPEWQQASAVALSGDLQGLRAVRQGLVQALLRLMESVGPGISVAPAPAAQFLTTPGPWGPIQLPPYPLILPIPDMPGNGDGWIGGVGGGIGPGACGACMMEFAASGNCGPDCVKMGCCPDPCAGCDPKACTLDCDFKGCCQLGRCAKCEALDLKYLGAKGHKVCSLLELITGQPQGESGKPVGCCGYYEGCMGNTWSIHPCSKKACDTTNGWSALDEPSSDPAKPCRKCCQGVPNKPGPVVGFCKSRCPCPPGTSCIDYKLPSPSDASGNASDGKQYTMCTQGNCQPGQPCPCPPGNWYWNGSKCDCPNSLPLGPEPPGAAHAISCNPCKADAQTGQQLLPMADGTCGILNCGPSSTGYTTELLKVHPGWLAGWLKAMTNLDPKFNDMFKSAMLCPYVPNAATHPYLLCSLPDGTAKLRKVMASATEVDDWPGDSSEVVIASKPETLNSKDCKVVYLSKAG